MVSGNILHQVILNKQSKKHSYFCPKMWWLIWYYLEQKRCRCISGMQKDIVICRSSVKLDRRNQEDKEDWEVLHKRMNKYSVGQHYIPPTLNPMSLQLLQLLTIPPPFISVPRHNFSTFPAICIHVSYFLTLLLQNSHAHYLPTSMVSPTTQPKVPTRRSRCCATVGILRELWSCCLFGSWRHAWTHGQPDQ